MSTAVSLRERDACVKTAPRSKSKMSEMASTLCNKMAAIRAMFGDMEHVHNSRLKLRLTLSHANANANKSHAKSKANAAPDWNHAKQLVPRQPELAQWNTDRQVRKERLFGGSKSMAENSIYNSEKKVMEKVIMAPATKDYRSYYDLDDHDARWESETRRHAPQTQRSRRTGKSSNRRASQQPKFYCGVHVVVLFISRKFSSLHKAAHEKQPRVIRVVQRERVRAWRANQSLLCSVMGSERCPNLRDTCGALHSAV